MDKTTIKAAAIVVVIFFGSLLGAGHSLIGETTDPDKHFAGDPIFSSQVIHFQPTVPYKRLVLSIAGPEGAVNQLVIPAGQMPAFKLPADAGDGSYTFELRIEPLNQAAISIHPFFRGLELFLEKIPLTQSGYFRVEGGAIVIPGDLTEDVNLPDDILHYDDVIITGSLCVGFDCVNGEYFGYDTIKLKENNLRIYFQDTSAGSFPTNDWRIVINDTTSGGASYFAVQDGNSSAIPFRIEAGAPSHSLYVEDYGRVGLGTSVPYVELHIVDGDTPTVRLDQDGSSGWTAQVWDLAGNETNFFIRDVTNGSKLCFRIQPDTPSNTLCMRSSGFVGIGTWSPESMLELEGTSEDIQILLDRTDGAEAQLTAKSNVVNIGSRSNHQVRFFVNQTTRMTLHTDDRMTMASGAECTAAGVWQDASSIDLKENVSELGSSEAMDTLTNLRPVKYNYKVDKTEGYVGFIAEEVPELVATKNRKTMSSMDVVAVLTKVVQDQQQTIAELNKKIDALEKELKK
jgi:hypothetical protein